MSKFRKLVLVPFDEVGSLSTKGYMPSLYDVRDDELNREAAIEWSRNKSRHSVSNKRPNNELIAAKILAIPDKAARGEALTLLSKLSKNPFIEWDELGNVTIYGTYLPGANLADLIRYSVYQKNPRDGRKKAVPPAYFQEFSAVAQRVSSESGSGYKRSKCPVHG